MAPPAGVRDRPAVLLTRTAIGVVFVADGWQKLVTNAVDATAAFFTQVRVPPPMLGPVRYAGRVFRRRRADPRARGRCRRTAVRGGHGRCVSVRAAGTGMFVQQGATRLVVILGAACLLLAAVGAGRYSLDHVLVTRRRTRRQNRRLH